MTGAQLRAARLRFHFTQSQLARRLHCSAGRVAYWEHEHSAIPSEWQLRIAMTFAMLLRSPLIVGQHIACPTCAGAGLLPAVYTKDGRLVPTSATHRTGVTMPVSYRYQTWQEQGLCGCCGKQAPEPPYKVCAACRKKVQESQARTKTREDGRRRPRRPTTDNQGKI